MPGLKARTGVRRSDVLWFAVVRQPAKVPLPVSGRAPPGRRGHQGAGRTRRPADPARPGSIPFVKDAGLDSPRYPAVAQFGILPGDDHLRPTDLRDVLSTDNALSAWCGSAAWAALAELPRICGQQSARVCHEAAPSRTSGQFACDSVRLQAPAFQRPSRPKGPGATNAMDGPLAYTSGGGSMSLRCAVSAPSSQRPAGSRCSSTRHLEAARRVEPDRRHLRESPITATIWRLPRAVHRSISTGSAPPTPWPTAAWSI